MSNQTNKIVSQPTQLTYYDLLAYCTLGWAIIWILNLLRFQIQLQCTLSAIITNKFDLKCPNQNM